MHTIMELREKYNLHMEVERYVSEDGIPDSDKKFIKEQVTIMAKTLVAYFSVSGVTKKTAEKLVAAAKADIYEIKPAVPYTKADLNWMDKKSRSSVEMGDKSFRPEIVKDGLVLTQYDTVLIGFPIWWYVAPTIINTFLESYDFSDKKIVLFATSGGSGIEKSISDLQTLYPDLHIVTGKRLNNASEEDVTEWISSLAE